jgi:hypothetical protein
MPGTYRVTVNSSGKTELIGTGLDSTINCIAGETVTLQSSVTGARD